MSYGLADWRAEILYPFQVPHLIFDEGRRVVMSGVPWFPTMNERHESGSGTNLTDNRLDGNCLFRASHSRVS
jgi:hypothetical protein